MLAQIEPPRSDFHALAHYLLFGKHRPTPADRVAWVFGHNLPDSDARRAAKIMAGTAERSRRCKAPCYHLSINWHPTEQPTPEVMQEIARRTLALAGLDEHQALIMGHGDTMHRHLHMMINRVHPGTGRAWSTSHDYRRFDRIMKQLSEEFGFRYVPGHAFEPEQTDELPKAPKSEAMWAAKRGADSGRPQWSKVTSRRYGQHINAAIDRATGWDDLEATFAADGLDLEDKGCGLVVGNAEAYTKWSALALTSSAKSFERRFGPRRRLSTRRRSSRHHDRNRRLHRQLVHRWFDPLRHHISRGFATLRSRRNLPPTTMRSSSSLTPPMTDASLPFPRRRNRATKPHARRWQSTRVIRAKAFPTISAARPSRRQKPPADKVRAWASRSVFAVDAIDIARAIGSKADVRQKISEVNTSRKARLRHAPLWVQLKDELKRLLTSTTSLSAASKRRPPHPPPRRQARRRSRTRACR